MTFLYKYPGNMIEYLDGKRYDIKKVDDHEVEQHLKDGWSLTTEEAEAESEPKKAHKPKAGDDAGL